METKRIMKYLENGDYCVLMPVYYECEEKPAWRKMFIGTEEECKERFNDYPDSLKATNDENKSMREKRFKEYLFLKETGRRKADCENIRKMYGFA